MEWRNFAAVAVAVAWKAVPYEDAFVVGMGSFVGASCRLPYSGSGVAAGASGHALAVQGKGLQGASAHTLPVPASVSYTGLP